MAVFSHRHNRALTQQPDYQTARKYWNKLKERLGKEGSESVTNCHRLKLPAADCKHYLTDVATAAIFSDVYRKCQFLCISSTTYIEIAIFYSCFAGRPDYAQRNP